MVEDLICDVILKHYTRAFNRKILKKRPSLAGHNFPPGSSGTFGEQTRGVWLSLEDVAYEWLHFKRGFTKRGNWNPRGRYDFHATRIASSSSAEMSDAHGPLAGHRAAHIAGYAPPGGNTTVSGGVEV